MKDNITDNEYEQIIGEIKKSSEFKLFEITEDLSDSETAFNFFHPDCYEIIYCARSFEWIVSGSHEGTVAFGVVKLY